MEQFPLLSILIWLPVFGAFLSLCVGDDKNANIARTIAVIVSVTSLLLCVPLYLGFDPNRYDMQFLEDPIVNP